MRLLSNDGKIPIIFDMSPCTQFLNDLHSHLTILDSIQFLKDISDKLIIEKSEEPGILSVCLGSSGAEGELLYIPGGGSKDPLGYRFLKMEGKEVFKEAVKVIESNSIEAIEKAGMKPEDINMFIPHQANLRIIEAARERLNLPLDKCYVNIDKYGNTSAASVLLALHEAVNESKIKKGDNVLFSVFGAGFAWGSAVVRW